MNYQLTLLSPVHIGTGNTLTPLDFILTDDALAVFDLKQAMLTAPDRTEELSAQIARDRKRFSLTDFLTDEERQNTAFWKYSAALDAATSVLLHDELHKGHDMDVSETLKTPVESQTYIPGSSLKGAFRTALAYTIFRHDEKLFLALQERLEHVDWRRSDEAVNDLLFWGARRNPNYDFFRTLQISDSSPVPATTETLAIGKLKILSLYESRKPEKPRQGTMFKQLEELRQNLDIREHSPLKPRWTFLEVLPVGTVLQGNIAVEDRLLQHAQASKTLHWNSRHQQGFSIENLIKAANTFALDVCQWELAFFETQVQGIDVTPIVRFYRDLRARITQANSNQCYVCVGHGAGWHKLTIGLLLERDQNFDFRKLRRDLRLASNRLQFAYPKSRKLLMASAEDIQSPLGWICVELQP